VLTSTTRTRVQQGFSPFQVALFIFSLVLWSIKLTNFEPTISMVSADSDRTQQVIRNLLSNAMGLQVLVVDDEDDNRKIITLALLEYNVKGITANCAMGAMEIVTQGNLDAIVSNIGMPDEDGYKLIIKIRD